MGGGGQRGSTNSRQSMQALGILIPIVGGNPRKRSPPKLDNRCQQGHMCNMHVPVYSYHSELTELAL